MLLSGPQQPLHGALALLRPHDCIREICDAFFTGIFWFIWAQNPNWPMLHPSQQHLQKVYLSSHGCQQHGCHTLWTWESKAPKEDWSRWCRFRGKDIWGECLFPYLWLAPFFCPISLLCPFRQIIPIFVVTHTPLPLSFTSKCCCGHPPSWH